MSEMVSLRMPRTESTAAAFFAASHWATKRDRLNNGLKLAWGTEQSRPGRVWHRRSDLSPSTRARCPAVEPSLCGAFFCTGGDRTRLSVRGQSEATSSSNSKAILWADCRGLVDVGQRRSPASDARFGAGSRPNLAEEGPDGPLLACAGLRSQAQGLAALRRRGGLYFFVSLAAARLTSASLTLPVFFLISPSVVLGEN